MDNGLQSLFFQTIKSTSGPDLLRSSDWRLGQLHALYGFLDPYPTAAKLAAVADAPASQTQYMCPVVGTGHLPEKRTQNYD